MSIAQTDQLLHLILNSLLLVTACVIVLSGMLIRHNVLTQQLRSIQREYSELIEGAGRFNNARFAQLKMQLRQLRHRYRVTHFTVLTAHYALLFCVASTLVVALRTLINANWLITVALVLFVLGVTILLLSIGLTLMDIYQAKYSLWQEIHEALRLGIPATLQSEKSVRRLRRSRPVPAKKSPGKRALPF